MASLPRLSLLTESILSEFVDRVPLDQQSRFMDEIDVIKWVFNDGLITELAFRGLLESHRYEMTSTDPWE